LRMTKKQPAAKAVRHWLKILSFIMLCMFPCAHLLAEPVQLPAGWTVAATQNGMATLKIAGSSDMALIGVLASGDAKKTATAIAAHVTSSYTIESTTPIQRLDNGIYVTIASLRFTNGQQGGNFVYAFPKPDGTTAITALITSALQNSERVKVRLQSLTGILDQLGQGRTLPGAVIPPVFARQMLVPVQSVQLPTGWPSGGLVTPARAAIDWPTALKMNLDPKRQMLPDRFECYIMDKEYDKNPRRAVPKPDATLTIRSNGTYDYTTDAGADSGTWQFQVEEILKYHDFTGPLIGKLRGSAATQTTTVIYSDHGQRIDILERSGPRRKLACHQAGPAAENARLEMARGVLGPETLQCVSAKDGGQFPVQFSGADYRSARGAGSMQNYSLFNGSTHWKGAAEFSGGPFDLAIGAVAEDRHGNRTVTIAIERTHKSAFLVSSSTEPIATCFGKRIPRPSAVYGAGRAPISPGKPGLQGRFSSMQSEYQVGGNIAFVSRIFSFAADGYYTDETPVANETDCTRLRPNGQPVCLRYEIADGRIRLQNNPGSWAGVKWEPFSRSGAGLKIDGDDYKPVRTLSALALEGRYGTQSSFQSGGIGIGETFTAFIRKGGLRFYRDGRFEMNRAQQFYSGTSTNALGQSAPAGPDRANKASGSTGRYQIEGNWLTLTRDTGEIDRLFIHLGGIDAAPGKSPEFLFIDGEQWKQL
jgi:hypothetical protein